MVGFPPFIQEFFLDPICNYSGYNFVNTLTYGIILIGIAFYLVFPFFNKRGIRFDFRFGLAVLAFVLFGSTLRILEDLKILGRSCNPFEPEFLTVTPGIYVAVGLLAIAALIFSIWLAKKIKQETIKVFGAIGTLLAAPFVLFDFIQFVAWQYFTAIIILTAVAVGISYLIAKKIRPQLVTDRLNLLAVAGQALDGSATFIATQFLNCGEQHPLSEAILGVFPAAFILVKVALALLIIYYVDKEVKDKNMAGFIKVFIIIMGFAPGIRDAFTVGVGTCF